MYGDTAVRAGASKLNTEAVCPSTEPTLDVTTKPNPRPVEELHEAVVALVQVEVEHRLLPISNEGVAFVVPKFNPAMVMGIPPVVGEFGVTEVAAAASNVKPPVKVPKREFSSTMTASVP